MNDIQKKIVKELKDNSDKLDFTGWYSPNCCSEGLEDLDDETPENSVYFTLHRDNTYDCESDCGERTEYDEDGNEEYSYSVCGDEYECNAVWDEEVIICSDGTINYNGELFDSVDKFFNALM